MWTMMPMARRNVKKHSSGRARVKDIQGRIASKLRRSFTDNKQGIAG